MVLPSVRLLLLRLAATKSHSDLTRLSNPGRAVRARALVSPEGPMKAIAALALLTAILIALKLGGDIDWSWWWVLSPVLLPISIASALTVLVAVIE